MPSAMIGAEDTSGLYVQRERPFAALIMLAMIVAGVFAVPPPGEKS
jgi:hypothetical protein